MTTILLCDPAGLPALSLDLPGVPPGQAKFLLAVAQLLGERGAASLNQLRDRLGLSSKNGIHAHLHKLIKKGWLAKEDRLRGTIRLARPLVWRSVEDVAPVPDVVAGGSTVPGGTVTAPTPQEPLP